MRAEENLRTETLRCEAPREAETKAQSWGPVSDGTKAQRDPEVKKGSNRLCSPERKEAIQ